MGIESSGGTKPVVIGGKKGLEVVVHRFAVTVESGPDQGHQTLLSSTSVIAGTDRSADLVLTDTTVSRRHTMLTITSDGIHVEDLGSRNGTWIGGARVQSAYLVEEALVQLGSTRLRVVPNEARFPVYADEADNFHGMLAHSEEMRRIFGMIRQLARTDLPVAIRGETGTGKELVARALHEAGPRRDKPFLVLDCGAIVPDLLASELFGHEKGAFTGADRMVRGVLEEADGGTVFLDEIGEVPLSLQPHLLRALETRTVCRIGSRQPTAVQFRVVSATNRNLRSLSTSGAFRADLYYRLACVTIRLPPLRERTEDLPLLVSHFLGECARRHGGITPSLSAGVIERLSAHPWPGNLRELRNVIESVWFRSGGEAITEADIAHVLADRDEPATEAGGTLVENERQLIADALKSTRWNRKAAAKKLGIGYTTIFEKIRLYGLTPPVNED
jgi:DNA-binding NtrC family response regulator